MLEIETIEEIFENPTLIELKSFSCRYPLSDSKNVFEATYCGKQKIKNSSYCKEHDELCISKRVPITFKPRKRR